MRPSRSARLLPSLFLVLALAAPSEPAAAERVRVPAATGNRAAKAQERAHKLQNSFRHGKVRATNLSRATHHEVGAEVGATLGVGLSAGIGKATNAGRDRYSLVISPRVLMGILLGGQAVARRTEFTPIERNTRARVPTIQGSGMTPFTLLVGRHDLYVNGDGVNALNRSGGKGRGYALGGFSFGGMLLQANLKLPLPGSFKSRGVRLAEKGERLARKAETQAASGDTSGAARTLERAERLRDKLDKFLLGIDY